MALVMQADLAGVGWLVDGCWFCMVWMGVVGWALLCLRRLAKSDARQGFCGAEERVIVGTVADALAFESVLLSDKFESRGAQMGKSVIIQGRIRGVVHCAANVKVDMAEFEGLRASVGGTGVTVLGWLEQPEEGHDDEVNDVSVKSSMDGVLGVDDVIEGAEDGHIDRVGAGRRVVVFAWLGEEISVWGMELACS